LHLKEREGNIMATRFTVRYLPDEENEDWIRIPKTGRIRIGRKQGEVIRIKTNKSSLKFKVHQGLTNDANKLVVRMAPAAMQMLGFKEGDTVEIEKKPKRPSEICIIALDCSLSMRDNGKIDKVKTALSSFLDEKKKIKEDNDMVGFVGFADDAWIISAPAADYELKGKKIGSSILKWGTNLVKPLQICRTMISGDKKKSLKATNTKDIRKHVIIIADGNSSEDPKHEAQKCSQSGIVIDAIGLIDPSNRDHQLQNLQTISSLTGGTYLPIDQADLATLIQRLSTAAKDKTLSG
jgi:Mg-chelatase subunit ChlD